ncbi:response regulator transcription factor [Flavisphingomonas formosensis]|uniref:response regulator transcription factor n=1 Tax=Flavisphingomonas formosensis TaxID=861534 RepID=UPI0012F9E319|nr:response regulator transcription factor [Sphingomonas formosensis]
MNVLLLEDDARQAGFIASGLRELGHIVHRTDRGDEALALLTAKHFDVAILDRMVPGIDGLTVLRNARAAGCETPVMLISALAAVADRVDGLEAGADDYLGKPFAFSELAARVNALFRRPARATLPEQLVVGEMEMDLRRRTVARGGRPIGLQPREFQILELLMRNPHRTVGRALLLQEIWDQRSEPQTNIVETHMCRLRSKLNDGFSTDAIRTVRGSGYVLAGG